MEQTEREEEQRMSVAQNFLQNIDAWAKSSSEIEGAHLVAPLIENISPIVTAFAIGNVNAASHQGKNSSQEITQMKTSVSRATKIVEKSHHELSRKPRETASPWLTIARKSEKLLDPTANLVKRRPAV